MHWVRQTSIVSDEISVMRFIIIIILFFECALAFCNAHAEGRCPPGYYPVGGQGVDGCAPIYGAQSQDTGQQQAAATSYVPPVRMRGHWAARWGAIAGDDGRAGSFGYSFGEIDRDRAEASAIASCEGGGGTGCTTAFVFENQCAAMSQPEKTAGRAIIRFSTGTTLAEAKKNAIDGCEEKNRTSCIIFISACSQSVFVSD